MFSQIRKPLGSAGGDELFAQLLSAPERVRKYMCWVSIHRLEYIFNLFILFMKHFNDSSAYEGQEI